MNMKIILGILFLVLLVACNGATGNTVHEDVIKVAFIGPITGSSAVFGLENLRGVELAVEQLNAESTGIKIKLIVKDDQFKEQETLTQYRQLVQLENVNYILTPTYGAFFTLADLVTSDDVILIDPLDASEELAGLSENIYGVGIYDESIGYAIADYLNEKKVKEIGLILNSIDPFAFLVKSAFENRFQGKIQEEKYSDERDFRTILTKLAKYEHVVLIGYEETGLIVRQARQMGLKTQFLGIDVFASEDFKENTGGSYEGLVFSFWAGAQDNPLFEEFMSRFEVKHGHGPSNVLFTATGYDSMTLLGSILQGCGDDVACVKAGLDATKGFPGATGEITIDSDGMTRSIRETPFTFRGGEIVPVTKDPSRSD